MVVCGACTYENPDGARKCEICGTPQARSGGKRKVVDQSLTSATSKKATQSKIFDGLHLWIVTSPDLSRTEALALASQGRECGAETTIYDGRARSAKTIPFPPPPECQLIFSGEPENFLESSGWESVPDEIQIRLPEFISESVERGALVSGDEHVWSRASPHRLTRSTAATNTNEANKATKLLNNVSNPSTIAWPITFELGSRSVTVCGMGLGTMPLCVCYPSERPSRAEAIKVIHAALAAGVRYFDTADTYCRDGKDMHYGEALLHEALATSRIPRTEMVVATKGGMTRMGETSSSWRNFVSPTSLDATIQDSARALGGTIDLWQLHHPPESVRHTLEQCLEVVQKHVASGLIKAVGICNATEEELVRASRVVKVSVVQDKFSLYELKSKAARAVEVRKVAAFCRKHRIPFVAYGVFGGTHLRQGKLPPLASKFAELAPIAKRLNVSVHALGLAFLKHHYFEDVMFLPIPGARNAAHIADCVNATKLQLSPTDLVAVAKAFA